MLYISDVDIVSWNFIITDSESGDSFRVGRDYVQFMHKGNLCEVEKVLGYLGGVACVLDERLIRLLDYIECVEVSSSSVGAIRLLSGGIVKMDDFGVCFYSGTNICFSLLDIILSASYHESFVERLKSGVIDVNLENSCLKIRLCGRYEPYIMKLVMMYRETDSYERITIWR